MKKKKIEIEWETCVRLNEERATIIPIEIPTTDRFWLYGRKRKHSRKTFRRKR